jgi:hypothetical protein
MIAGGAAASLPVQVVKSIHLATTIVDTVNKTPARQLADVVRRQF